MARKRSSASRRRHRALADFQHKLEEQEDGPEQAAEGDQPGSPQPAKSHSARMLDASSSRMKTRRAPKARSKDKNLVVPLISLAGLGLAALFGTKFLLDLPGDEPEPVREERSVNISWDHPRVQAIVEWIGAIHAGNNLVLRRHSDFGALQAFLEVDPDRPLSSANTVDRDDIEQLILAELRGGEKTEPFRDFVPREGRLDDASMHTSEAGTVFVQMPPREESIYTRYFTEKGKRYHKGYDAQVRVSFVTSGSDVLVTGWEVLHKPRKPRAKRAPHAKIAAPVLRETEFGGEKIVVAESEPVPLDHLADTPPELRREIDDLIATLMDPDSPGAEANRSMARLKEIGRPAIPRLLTQMYEAPLDTLENRIALRGITRALSDMSGQRFGFTVTDTTTLGAGGTDAERQSALKQWYAWWYNNFDSNYTTAIDTDDDETLLLTEQEKAKLRAEESEATEATVPRKR